MYAKFFIDLCYNEFKLTKGGGIIKKTLIFIFIALALLIFSFHLQENMLTEKSVKIFIIDSEIDREFLNSPALKIKAESSHGSKIAAVIRNLSRAEIIPLSAENIISRIDKENYLNALKKVKNYARLHPRQKIIVNISLGFEERNFQEDIIDKIASFKNIILVAAAGNNNRENLSYPAAFKNVTAVAALENNKKMPASNYGKNIDFAAPGVIEITQRHFLPTLNYSRSYKLSGTSFAAPQLSALLANILSINPEVTIKQALKIIKNTAVEINDSLFKEGKLGAGRIDQFKALTKTESLYFWLQLAICLSIAFAALLFFYLCWQKYSLSGIFIFLISSSLIYLLQPFLMLLYYRFGLFKIIIFLTGLVIFYSAFLKSISIYLNKTNNINFILKLAPYLNQNLRTQAEKRIRIFLKDGSKLEKEKYKKLIKKYLRNCGSKRKCIFYLQTAAQLDNPPLSLIINKAIKFNLSPKLIAESLKSKEKSKEHKILLNIHLLELIKRESYSVKKKAAATAAEMADPVILVTLKNMLSKRNALKLNSESQYFLLDLLAAFGPKAADFSALLEKIIVESSDPWLKYHGLKAYIQIAGNEQNYQKFIEQIKAKEKEPVTLALKD